MVRMIPNSQCCSIGFGPVQMLGFWPWVSVHVGADGAVGR